MSRPSKLAEAIAKKAFQSPAVQQSWQVHMQAFGPVLSPAYADCYTAKIHITNILNKISRRDVAGAQSVMDTLRRSCGCETAADMALLDFLAGLCCEVSGDRMHMFGHYSQAANHGARFYLLHLKNARFAHQSGEFDVALAEYMKALDLIRAMAESPARNQLLSSTLVNTASVLTYMHRYADAEAALNEGLAGGPVPRSNTVKAVLLAAMDREAEMEECLVALAEADDPEYDTILDRVQAIMNGEDPYFCPQKVNEEAIAAFWAWFAENEQELLELYRQQDEELPEAFTRQLEEHLAPCFPFDHPPFEMGGSEDFPPCELFFFCGYHQAMTHGYAALCDACPADLASRWSFTVER